MAQNVRRLRTSMTVTTNAESCQKKAPPPLQFSFFETLSLYFVECGLPREPDRRQRALILNSLYYRVRILGESLMKLFEAVLLTYRWTVPRGRKSRSTWRQPT